MNNENSDILKTYPIIKFPFKIQPYFNSKIPELNLISPPEKEKVKNPSIFTPLFLALCFFISFKLFNYHFFLFVTFFLFTIILSFVLVGSIQSFLQEKKKALSDYNASLESYLNSIKNQDLLRTKLITQEQKNNYIKKRIQEIANQSPHSELIMLNLAKKGKSEYFFLTHLRFVFGKNIKINQAIIEQDWKYNYIPDFIYSDGNLNIDIEIDEPYSFQSLEPIHYFEINKNEHTDSNRDDYFLRRNWFVIRFSEIQVCESPLSCCRIIANIINVVADDPSFINKLENIPKLTKHSLWTYEEAKTKIQENFRNSYLYEKNNFL